MSEEILEQQSEEELEGPMVELQTMKLTRKLKRKWKTRKKREMEESQLPKVEW